MTKRLLESAFANLSTDLIADACVRLQVPLRIAPSGIHPLVPEMRVAGRVLPSRHRGSVDVFLEAMRKALPGDVPVVDNDGRSDESCVGDLTVLEARAWGVAGLVVRGYHRDTDELVRLGIPVFSNGSYPAGPRRLDQRGPLDLSSAQWDGFTVDGDDVVFADDDGVLFVPSGRIEDVLKVEVHMEGRAAAGQRQSRLERSFLNNWTSTGSWQSVVQIHPIPSAGIFGSEGEL